MGVAIVQNSSGNSRSGFGFVLWRDDWRRSSRDIRRHAGGPGMRDLDGLNQKLAGRSGVLAYSAGYLENHRERAKSMRREIAALTAFARPPFTISGLRGIRLLQGTSQ